MSYHDEDKETAAVTLGLGGIFMALTGLAAAGGLVWLLVFAPAAEQGRHDTYKQTQGAVDAKNLTIANSCDKWSAATTDSEKAAIKGALQVHLEGVTADMLKPANKDCLAKMGLAVKKN